MEGCGGVVYYVLMTIEHVGVMYGKIPQGIYLQLLEVPGLLTTPILVWKSSQSRILSGQSLNESLSLNRKKRKSIYETKSTSISRVWLIGI